MRTRWACQKCGSSLIRQGKAWVCKKDDCTKKDQPITVKPL